MFQLAALPLAASFAFPCTPAAHIHLAEASAPLRELVEIGSLAAIDLAPERWLGEAQNVIVQFESEPDGPWNPFLTRFHAADFRRVRFWGDEQWLWLEGEFNRPLGELFVRRDSLADAVLSGARKHDRFALEIVTRELHAGRAWIEITGARWTGEQTPEGTVLHAIRGLDLIQREAWALAVSEFERALRPNLPGHARRELTLLRDQAEEARKANIKPVFKSPQGG